MYCDMIRMKNKGKMNMNQIEKNQVCASHRPACAWFNK